MAGNPEYTPVLKKILSWPPEERMLLAHALLESVADSAQTAQLKPTLDQLVGIARGSGPAPSDEQVKEWIDEFRVRKYGA